MGVHPEQLCERERVPSTSERNPYWILALILLLAFAFRFYALDRNPLWYDEAAYAEASRGLPANVLLCRGILLSPLFCAFIGIWEAVGRSDVWMRTQAVLFGLGLVAVAWTLGGRLAGKRGAVASALFAALAPFLVYYSRDAKMYALVALMELGIAYLAIAYGTTAKRWHLAAYVAIAIPLLYTHLTTPFYLAAVNVLFIAFYARSFRRAFAWCAAQGVVLVGAIPFLIAHHRFAKIMVERSFWAPPPELRSLYQTACTMLVGYAVDDRLRLAGCIAGGILVLAAVIGLTGRRRTVLFLLALAAANVLIAFVYSRHSHISVYVDRYLIGSCAPLIVVAACGLAALPRTGLRAIAAAGIAGIAAGSLYDLYAYRFSPDPCAHLGVYRTFDAHGMRNFIRTHAQPGDAVWHPSWTTQIQLRWYVPEYEHVLIDMGGQVKRRLDGQFPHSEQHAYGIDPIEIESAFDKAGRIWLVLPGDLPQMSTQYAGFAEWLGARAHCVERQYFSGRYAPSWLYLFEAADRGVDAESACQKATLDVAQPSQDTYQYAEVSAHLEGPSSNKAGLWRFVIANGAETPLELNYEIVTGYAECRAAAFEREMRDESQWVLRPYTSMRDAHFAMCALVKPSSDPRDALTTTTDLPPGKYRVFIERVLQGPQSNLPAPTIRADVGGTIMESTGTASAAGWQWGVLGTLDKKGPSPTLIRVKATDPAQRPESFAAFSRILFRAWDGSDSPENADPVRARGRISIKAGGEGNAAMQPSVNEPLISASAWTNTSELRVWRCQND